MILQPTHHIICTVDASSETTVGDAIDAAVAAGDMVLPLKKWRGFCVGGIFRPSSTDITVKDEFGNGGFTVNAASGPMEIISSSIVDHIITCSTDPLVFMLYLLKAKPTNAVSA